MSDAQNPMRLPWRADGVFVLNCDGDPVATADPARVSQLAGEVAKLRAEKAVHAPHYDFVSP